MILRILGRIACLARVPTKYFGSLDIYIDNPPLFIPFSFEIADNRKMCPRISFFDNSSNLFLKADGSKLPEKMKLNPDQMLIYGILMTAVSMGIFNILSRDSCGFILSAIGKNNRSADKIVDYMLNVINLSQEQEEALIRIGKELGEYEF